MSTNPIVGLVIHHPNADHKSPSPRYSLARLSVTFSNQDWYETNLPLGPLTIPQWVYRLSRAVKRTVPRAVALRGGGTESDSSSEDDEQVPREDKSVGIQVHPHRCQIMGLTASPGGGTTLVLVSKFSTVHPTRSATTKLLFGWHEKISQPDKEDGGRTELSATSRVKSMTTEGTTWEWMYGLGPDILIKKENDILPANETHNSLRQLRERQTCVFHEMELRFKSRIAFCEYGNGHSFGMPLHCLFPFPVSLNPPVITNGNKKLPVLPLAWPL